MRSVEFNETNLGKCLCGGCPVQRDSACAAEKADKLPAKMHSMPEPEEVPGIYCSTGNADCGDLDYSKNCLCPGCPVYSQNALAEWKYCQQGSASEIG